MDTATPESMAAERTSSRKSYLVNGKHKSVKRLTVVFCPPRKVSAPDDILEDESDDGPWNVVYRTRWGNSPHTAENNGEAERECSREKHLRMRKRKRT